VLNAMALPIGDVRDPVDIPLDPDGAVVIDHIKVRYVRQNQGAHTRAHSAASALSPHPRRPLASTPLPTPLLPPPTGDHRRHGEVRIAAGGRGDGVPLPRVLRVHDALPPPPGTHC